MRFLAILLVAFVFFGNAICSAKHNSEHSYRDEALNMVNSLKDLSDKEKEDLVQDLLRGMENDHEVPSGKRGTLETEQTSVLLYVLIGTLAVALLLFSYKLYKKLTEQERREQEKKRGKESRKKST